MSLRSSNEKCKRVHSGFTLVEMLVVISIIALLAAILFPVYSAVREKARQTSCMSNMRQIGMALTMYMGDKGDKFPPYVQGQYSYTSGEIGTSPMSGPGVKIAEDKRESVLNPTTPADRFVLSAQGANNFHYYSWMDCLFKYTNSVEVFTCPSHKYPIDLLKTSPPFDGTPENYPGEVNSGLRWWPSLAVNGTLMFAPYNGQRNWSMAEINGAAGKIVFVHNKWSYQYQNAYDYGRIAMNPANSAQAGGTGTQQGTFPHNDGSIIIFADGHAKWISRTSVPKYVCYGTPGWNLYQWYSNTCGYWNPTIAPPV